MEIAGSEDTGFVGALAFSEPITTGLQRERGSEGRIRTSITGTIGALEASVRRC